MSRGERMGQAAEPLAEKGLDLRTVELVGDPLHAFGIGAGVNTVIERSVGDAPVSELAFEPLVAIQTDLHRIGKVGTELDEQGTEVAIDQVDVIMVHHRRGPDDPGVAGAVASLPFLGTKDIRLLLGLADEQDAFVPLEPGQILLGHVVFSLPLPEPHQVDLFGLDEVFHGFHEPAAHRRDHGCRGHTHAQLGFLEVGEPRAGLQGRHIAIQVHAVYGFQFEGDMSIEDLSDVFAYHDDGAPGERSLTRANDPNRVQYLDAGCNPCLLPGAPFSFTRFTNAAPPQTRDPTSIRIHARGSEAKPR